MMPTARFEPFTVAELKILKQAIAQGLTSKTAQATGRKLTKEIDHSLKRKETFKALEKYEVKDES